MNWKMNFLFTAALIALTSSQLYVDGYLRNASYNIPNIIQRTEKEQRLLKSQLIIPTPIGNHIKSHARDNFYKGERSLETEYIPNVSTIYCKEQVLLKNVDNYPTDYVNKLIDEKIHNIFNQSPEHLEGISQDNTRRRLRTFRLCRFRREEVVPFAAYVPWDDKCYFVVNRNDHPVQSVKYEACEYKGDQCTINGIPTLNEQIKRQPYNTSCDQTYIRRSLIVLDHNGELRQKPVYVKAACVCTKTLNPKPQDISLEANWENLDADPQSY